MTMIRRTLALLALLAAPALAQDYAIRLDTQYPQQTLQPLTFLQGATPRLVFKPFENGVSIGTDATNYYVKFSYATTATNAAFVATNSAYGTAAGTCIAQLTAAQTDTNGTFWFAALLMDAAGLMHYSGTGTLTVVQSTVTGAGSGVTLSTPLNAGSYDVTGDWPVDSIPDAFLTNIVAGTGVSVTGTGRSRTITSTGTATNSEAVGGVPLAGLVQTNLFAAHTNTHAQTAEGGFRAGSAAYAESGAAVGALASAQSGAAVGSNAVSTGEGVAIGPATIATDSVQIGRGTNTSVGTVQFYGWPLLGSSGQMELARMTNHTGAADPHTGYLLASGARAMTGPLDGGGQATTNWVQIQATPWTSNTIEFTSENDEHNPSVKAIVGTNGTTHFFSTGAKWVAADSFGTYVPIIVGDPTGGYDAVPRLYADDRYWQRGDAVTNVSGNASALTNIPGAQITAGTVPTGALATAAHQLYANDVDASGFSGNLGPTVTNLQALADAVDVLDAGSGGTSTSDVKSIAFDSGMVPAILLGNSATTTVTRLTGTNVYHWILTTNSTLTFADSWPTSEVGRVTIELERGAFTPSFNTAVITNSTLLDLTATNTVIPLFFRKPITRTMWRAAQ